MKRIEIHIVDDTGDGAAVFPISTPPLDLFSYL